MAREQRVIECLHIVISEIRGWLSISDIGSLFSKHLVITNTKERERERQTERERLQAVEDQWWITITTTIPPTILSTKLYYDIEILDSVQSSDLERQSPALQPGDYILMSVTRPGLTVSVSVIPLLQDWRHVRQQYWHSSSMAGPGSSVLFKLGQIF